MNNSIYNKIKYLKLNSAMLSTQLFAGNFLSIFSGQGTNFKELRQYYAGDDFRTIDWATTARFNQPFVKINEEERQQNIVFLIDISKSIEFGNIQNNKTIKNKKDIVAELCFLLAYSSVKNNDQIGAVFFSDKIEKVVPLSKKQSNIPTIVKMLYDFETTNTGTNLEKAIKFANTRFKKNTIIFIISDFFTDVNFEKNIIIASKKFKLIAIQITDLNETNITAAGLIKVLNKETNEIEYIDISNSSATFMHAEHEQKKIEMLMKKNSIHFIKIDINENYLVRLKLFFDNIKKKM